MATALTWHVSTMIAQWAALTRRIARGARAALRVPWAASLTATVTCGRGAGTPLRQLPAAARRARRSLQGAAAALLLVLASCGASMTAPRRCIAILTACGRIVSLPFPRPTRRPSSALRRAFRPACGRPKVGIIASPVVHQPRRGRRAKVHRAVRRHANPFVGITEQIFITAWGEETLGVDPTPRQRGPCRPPRIGRQGRLPTWPATLCRVSQAYRLHYQSFLITDLQSQSRRNRMWRPLKL